MSLLVRLIILKSLLCSLKASNIENPTFGINNKAQTLSFNFVNDKLSGNENDETGFKIDNLNSEMNENVLNSPKFALHNANRAKRNISSVSEVDKLVFNLVNKSYKQNTARINSNISVIQNSPEYRKLLDISDRLEKASNYNDLNEYADRNELDLKYLIYNSYTNEHDSNGDIEQNYPYSMSEEPSIENPDFKDTVEEKNETLLQRMLKASRKFMCSILPFVKCLEAKTHKDIEEAEEFGSYHVIERGDEEEEPITEKVLGPTVIVQQTCPLGKYVTELDLCLFFVLKESRFTEAKETCDSLVEGGELWVTDRDAWDAAAILDTNKVVKGDYSAWIDGVFFEDTLAGTGHFDSKYKKWLNLGEVRGKRKSKDNIVLNRKKGDIFYSYDEGRRMHPFVCQARPIDYEHLVWNERYSRRRHLPYEI